MKKDISTGKIIHVYYHDKTGIYKLLFTHKKYIYLKDISYWTKAIKFKQKKTPSKSKVPIYCVKKVFIDTALD